MEQLWDYFDSQKKGFITLNDFCAIEELNSIVMQKLESQAKI